MNEDSPLEKLCKQAEREGKWLVRRGRRRTGDKWYAPGGARCWFRHVTGFELGDPAEQTTELTVRLNQLDNAKKVLRANGIEVVE